MGCGSVAYASFISVIHVTLHFYIYDYLHFSSFFQCHTGILHYDFNFDNLKFDPQTVSAQNFLHYHNIYYEALLSCI